MRQKSPLFPKPLTDTWNISSGLPWASGTAKLESLETGTTQRQLENKTNLFTLWLQACPFKPVPFQEAADTVSPITELNVIHISYLLCISTKRLPSGRI